MPDDEDVVFDDAMRESDVSALSKLMADMSFQERCSKTCGAEKMDQFRANHRKVESGDVGRVVEAVVNLYGAPHLRPSTILEKAADENAATGACWSLVTFMQYAAARSAAEGGVAPAS
mmetsp:Transcript_26371/g.85172  ORF Transcript_26371/g.85172 Transcript_26371/m.85172 type:complete len:118 (+) Transcript_26371:225-578(+)